MSRRLALALVSLVLLWTSTPSARVDPPGALLVTGHQTLSTGERDVQTRLAKLGYRVIVVTDRGLTNRETADKALIVIAATALPSPLGAKLASLPVPIITWQPQVLRTLGMGAPTEGVDFGAAGGQSALLVSNGSHTLAAGLSGLTTVSAMPQSFAWTLPSREAIVIASLAQDPNRAAVVAYEQGTEMWDRRAPARRVGLFAGSGLNHDGWRLFDEAVRWATTRNLAPRVDAGPDQDVTLGDGAHLYGVVEDDGVPEPPWVQIVWSAVSGPAEVNFDNPTGRVTKAHFTKSGQYVLRLTAADRLASASDDVTVVVRPAKGASAAPGATRLPQPLVLAGQPVLEVIAGAATSGDNDIKNRLLGATLGASSVTLKSCASTSCPITSADWTGKALVVIAPTADQTGLGTKLRDATVPVVDLKAQTFGNMKMTGTTSGTHFGTQAGTTISIPDPSQPLAAGLSGTPQVTGISATYGWGAPPTTATRVATIAGVATKWVIFAYKTNDDMFGSPAFKAPAYRVGFFAGSDTAVHNLNANGWTLFDTAVKWATTTNLAPYANAGADQGSIPVGFATTLIGTVNDDGLPNPLSCPGGVCWTKASGPGTVTFSNPSSCQPGAGNCSTTATFTAIGQYTLRLQVSDGALLSPVNGDSDVAVTVVASNTPPTVNAGPDQPLTLPAAVHLVGAATDDGVPDPPHALSCPGGVCWTEVNGPGTVTFTAPGAYTTDASFSIKGTYVLRLTVTDGQFTSSDDLTVTVSGNALLVMDGNPSHAGTIQAELEALGYAVAIKDSFSAVTADATGRNLIFITSKTGTASLGTQFRDSAVPVIVANANFFDDMRMTDTASGTFGITGNQAKIAIVGLGHPLAGGLNGSVIVSTTTGAFGWGKPPATAAAVARLMTDQNALTIYGYTTGATMAGTPTFTAPARRVGFFMPDDVTGSLTAGGTALLDAAILWATSFNTAPTAYAGPDLLIPSNGTAAPNGQIWDDGQPVVNLTGSWSKVSGPGGVVFTPAFPCSGPSVLACTRNATFSQPGSYVLRLTGSDTALTGSDDVVVSVTAPGGNQDPLVDAGLDQTITMPPTSSVTLTGTARDDGLPSPPAALSCPTGGCWKQVSGPGTASIATPTCSGGTVSSCSTNATFNVAGSYVFRYSVTDGFLVNGSPKVVSDDVTVFVNSTALLVVGAITPLDAGDAAMKARLEALGYTVTLELASDATYATTNKAVIIQSSSAFDADLCPGTPPSCKLKSIALPVVTMAASVFSDMSLTDGINQGNLGLQTRLSIPTTSESHPMAAGLKGTPLVNTTPSNYSWGVPRQTIEPDGTPAAAVIATAAPNDASKPVIFAYTEGHKLQDGTPAAARRVGFGLFGQAVSSLTSSGTALFDAMIRWATKTNTAPHVYAGSNQLVVLPNTASISATVTDDGLPNPPAAVTCPPTPAHCWTQVSGPGTVTFANANAFTTTATFPTPGDYVLSVTAFDGNLSSSSSLVITVLANGTVNQPPTVNAGPDQSVKMPGAALLHATYSDDGLPTPPGGVTVTWSQVSGPGIVTPPTATGVDAAFTFPVAGLYILRATASDGCTPPGPNCATVADDVSIYVENPGKSALLITNNCTLAVPDQAVKQRLERLGFTVNCTVTGAIGSNDLAVVSGLANSGGLVNYKNAAKPMIVMDPTGYDELGLTAVGSSGVVYTTAQINVTNPSHPLAAGLQGSATVKSTGGGLGWGLPGNGATIVATVSGDASKPALFAYEKGATFVDNTTAAHRRVGFFGADDLTTAQGLEMFDAAATWALGSSVPALFVPGSSTLSTSDAAVKQRLENLGFAVTVIQGSAAQDSDANGKAVVVISGTITDTTFGNKFQGVTVPVVTWEQNIFDNLGMATAVGTSATQTKIDILDPAHALAAGLGVLDPVVDVANSAQTFGWGTPTTSAAKVAKIHLDSTNTKATVFGYELGAAMVSSSAPDRRVGLFFPANFFAPATPPALPAASASAWAIFDAAIKWATGSDADQDGLTIFQEYFYGTDPRNPDTNSDGIRDGLEVQLGLSPTNLDMDSDTVTNAQELINGTDPFNPDTDGDGVNDGVDCFPLDKTYPSPNPCPTDPTLNQAPCIKLTEPVNLTPTVSCTPASSCGVCPPGYF